VLNEKVHVLVFINYTEYVLCCLACVTSDNYWTDWTSKCKVQYGHRP